MNFSPVIQMGKVKPLTVSWDLKKLFLLTHVSALPVCVYVHHLYALGPQSPEEDNRSPRTKGRNKWL